jgi:integrase
MLDKVRIPRNTSTADRFIRDLEKQETQYQVSDSDVKGLYIRIYPSGQKVWMYRYNVKSGDKWRDRSIKLGGFRTKANSSEGLTTTKARQQASAYKVDIQNKNIDPQEEKRKKAKQRREAELEITVNQLFDHWLSDEVSKRKDGGAEVERMFNKDVLPFIGKHSIKDVRKRDIAKINSRVKQRSDRMANMVFSLVRQMFTYAVMQDYLEFDPTYGIKKSKVGTKGNIRERFLNDDEIRELFEALPKSDLQCQYQLAVKIMLGTCCRVGELSKARWDNVDFEKRIWTIPEIDSKNGKKHKVWLSDFVLDQFKVLYTNSGETPWCFPSRSGDSHINNRTISKHVTDRQKTQETRIKSRTPCYDSLLLHSDSGEVWKPHDLRRTGATIMVRYKVVGEVVERCLNHLEQNRLKKTYLQYDYWDEMQNAWDLLGEKLEALDLNV